MQPKKRVASLLLRVKFKERKKYYETRREKEAVVKWISYGAKCVVQQSYLFPSLAVPFYIIRQWTKSLWSDRHQPLYIFPALIWQPGKWFGPRTLLQRDVSLQEEVQLFWVQLAVCLQDFDGHLEREQQLVTFKQT